MTRRHAKPALSRIELLQGTLDMIILQALRWGPRHGYGLVQLVRATLHRLERQKFVKAEWTRSDNKQRVRVYRLTPAGRKRLIVERSRWEQLTQAIEGLFAPPSSEEI
jgi:DNA-binding PadR family transcriptional regulator